MSGIFGIFGKTIEDDVQNMGQAIEHRGSHQTLLTNHQISFGQCTHREFNASNKFTINEITYWIAFDGFIYNRNHLLSLIDDTEKNSLDFSDAELVANLFHQFGTSFPSLLTGPFAIVIYDGSNLFMSRDVFGIRPFFTLFDRGKFLFCSEIKGILAASPNALSISSDSLIQRYVLGDHLLDNSTYFSEVQQLLPGGFLKLYRRDGKIEIESGYCDHYTQKEKVSAVAITHQEIKNIINQNIQNLVNEYENVGILLSGGFDSSIIAALATKYSNKPIKTFTISDDANFPDILAARKVAQHLNTDHEEIIVDTACDSELLRDGIIAYEDLTFRDTIFRLLKNVSGKVDLVLSGAGADLFGIPVSLKGNKIESIKSNWLKLQNITNGQIIETGVGKKIQHLLNDFENNRQKTAIDHFINHYLPNQLFPSSERVASVIPPQINGTFE
jgi:asparagine synthase (glutamine-hydrolysing)